MDVSQPDAVLRVVSATERERGALHVLVNNAGVFALTHLLDDFERALTDWEHIVGTNLFGSYLFGRACVPLLVASGGGDIVNVSTDHVRPPPGRPTGGSAAMDVYDASKWALDGLTQAWARGLRTSNVRVNALCMGATDTPMLRAALPAASAAEIASWLRPEQIARVLIELLREGSDGRSGENIGLWPGHPVELPRR
jgi:NAD(P)-dependent dehydrogenase (short-subunit alcohol dehydrogenase family)